VLILDNVFRKGERRGETFGCLGLGLKKPCMVSGHKQCGVVGGHGV